MIATLGNSSKSARAVGTATEVVIAAKNEDPQELIYETADVLYHLLVLLAEKNIPYEAIEAELASREGVVSKTTDRPEITNL